MKKVLFINYFFPPIGGGGVLRVTKFVKYLPSWGYKPTVLTVKKGFYPIEDKSLLEELPAEVKIERVDYFEPAFWFRSRYWQGFLKRIIYRWFLPDDKIFWFLPGLLAAYKLVKSENIKIIFTSSYSYTDHLIAWFLKKLTNVYWIADFRDEWSKSTYSSFSIPVHKSIIKYLEKKFLALADKVITVSEGLTKDYRDILGVDPGKFFTITNGFDGADFEKIKSKSHKKNCEILYTGNLYGGRRNDLFLQAFNDLKLKNLRSSFLGRKIRVSHKEAITRLLKADILLLILSPKDTNAVMTGKLFEYLAARKPILALAPAQSGAARLIKQLKVGVVVDPLDKKQIKAEILKMYRLWERGELKIPQVDIEKFDRRNLTAKLARIFKSLTNERKIRLCLIGNVNSIHNRKICQYFKQDYEVHFITTQPGKHPGVKVYHQIDNEKKDFQWFVRAFFAVRQLVTRIKPDIVHGQSLTPGGILAGLSGFRPYILTVWGSDVLSYEDYSPMIRYLIKAVLKKADLILGSSAVLFKKVREISGPKHNFQKIYFGIDLDIFQKKEVKHLKRKLHLKVEKIIFSPRAMSPIYNIETLIRAFGKLAQKNPQLKLIIIESVPRISNLKKVSNQAYFALMKKLIFDLGLKDRVIIVSELTNKAMADYYNLADVVVTIPDSDSSSISFLEALACEKKVVTTKLGFAKEWFKNNNFWLASVKDVSATAQAIKKALSFSESRFQKIGRTNRQMVKEKAEYLNNMQKLERIYQDLI